MALSQGTISTVAWLPVRAVFCLVCSEKHSSSQSTNYRFLWGSGQEPLCLREAWLAQNSMCEIARVKIAVASMAYYHSKSMTSIQSLVCLKYLCKPEGRCNKEATELVISSRPIMLLTLLVDSFISVSIIYVISGLREACAYKASLRARAFKE